MKRYRLNVSFGKYKPGQEISQEELAALCQNCAYIHEIPDTPEQTTKEGFTWTDELVVEFTSWSLTKSPTFQGRYADVEYFKKMKASKQSQSNTQ